MERDCLGDGNVRDSNRQDEWRETVPHTAVPNFPGRTGCSRMHTGRFGPDFPVGDETGPTHVSRYSYEGMAETEIVGDTTVHCFRTSFRI